MVASLNTGKKFMLISEIISEKKEREMFFALQNLKFLYRISKTHTSGTLTVTLYGYSHKSPEKIKIAHASLILMSCHLPLYLVSLLWTLLGPGLPWPNKISSVFSKKRDIWIGASLREILSLESMHITLHWPVIGYDR